MSIQETLKYTADWYLAYRNKKDMYKFTVDQINKFTRLKWFVETVKKKNLKKFQKLVNNQLAVFF